MELTQEQKRMLLVTSMHLRSYGKKMAYYQIEDDRGDANAWQNEFYTKEYSDIRCPIPDNFKDFCWEIYNDRTGRIQHRIVVRKGNAVEDLPVAVHVEGRPSAVGRLHAEQPVDGAAFRGWRGSPGGGCSRLNSGQNEEDRTPPRRQSAPRSLEGRRSL